MTGPRSLRSLAVLLGGQPWLLRFAPWIVGLDRLIHRVSGDRLSLLMTVGLPELILRVPGRRTGMLRETPLLCLPYAGGWLVVGSNWGQPHQPAWVGNLLAAGSAEVGYRGRTHRVVPRELTGADRDRAWRELTRVWPNYDKYAARTSRPLPVLELNQTARQDARDRGPRGSVRTT